MCVINWNWMIQMSFYKYRGFVVSKDTAYYSYTKCTTNINYIICLVCNDPVVKSYCAHVSYFIIWHQILFTGSPVDNLRGYISDKQFCITSHFSGCLDQISLLLFDVHMIWCLFGIPMIWCLKQSSTLYTLIKNNYNFFELNNAELYKSREEKSFLN